MTPNPLVTTARRELVRAQARAALLCRIGLHSWRQWTGAVLVGQRGVKRVYTQTRACRCCEIVVSREVCA